VTVIEAGAPAPARSPGDEPAVTPEGAAAGRSVGSILKEVVLTVAGIVGLLGIAWLACAALFGLSVVVFKTGSMAPTIPTGSAAIVQDIDAPRIEVGDIVTVGREGELPVTHRVISIEAAVGDPAARVLTLQGDANDLPDFNTYTVTEVKRVVVSLADAGFVLAVARSPFVLAATSLVVALLVIWAFWPQGDARRLSARRQRGSDPMEE
jgi:signal peptidase I